MFFPNTVIAETLKMLIEQLSIVDGIKMVKQVVLIRVNLIVYPIDHIAVNHIALDSIPNARENIYSNRIVCIIQSHILIISCYCILKQVGGLLTYMFILILQKEFGK